MFLEDQTATMYRSWQRIIIGWFEMKTSIPNLQQHIRQIYQCVLL